MIVRSGRPGLRTAALFSAATVALIPTLVSAQDEPGAAEPPQRAERAQSPERAAVGEIVVTGSLIRGAAPVGSNLISVGQERIESTGATTSNELLATIPQVSNYFNSVPVADLNIAANQIQVSRPNLRNLTPRAAATSATLILIDGHRIATAGTRQSSIDPDVIPSGAIERVEVVTEGGSATYGADAVAGVINFITRKRFDGVSAEARYGLADDYWQFDANATVGKDWGPGSAYLSYTYTKNRALFGRDRDFIRGVSYTSVPYVPLGRSCDVGNVRFANFFTGDIQNYSVANLTAQGVSTCDTTDESSSVPAAERHGMIARLNQDLSPSTTIDAKAFYSERVTKSYGSYRGTVTIGPNNPFFRPVPGRVPSAAFPNRSPNDVQTVDFSFAPALGRSSAESRILLQEWGVATELRQRLAGDWQARGLFNYSRSNTRFNQPGVNTGRLASVGNCGVAGVPCPGGLTPINPYDVTQSSRSLLDTIIDNENAAQARDELLNLRLIADGSLLALPGGDVRLAVGYEYMHDMLRQRERSGIQLGALASAPYNLYTRTVHSVFGELNLPIFGEDNAVPGLESLVVSAQGRWDDYSDFGSTFNPKIGVTYKPVDWLTLRGNWGTSFTAPSPLDQLNSVSPTLTLFPAAFFIRPEDRLAGVNALSGTTLSLQGSQPNLRPQTAETWSLGLDINPPFISGVRASLNYYNVSFENILSIPTPGDAIFINFPNIIQTRLPSLGGLDPRTFVAPGGPAFGAIGADTAVQSALADGRPVYTFVDFRVGNYGTLKVEGLDFSLNYRTEFGFGSVDFGVSGNYVLNRTSQASLSAPEIDDLRGDAMRGADGSARLNLQTVAGADIGRLRAQVTWNHTSSFPIPPTPLVAVQPNPPVPIQTRVGSFDVINLFFRYDVAGESVFTKDLSFTFNVNNLLDEDPPLLLRNGQAENGYYNTYFTLGRMFIFGVAKRF